ncbi:mitochondrial fission ELM1 family protein [Cognatiluteimonas telluris]|uniref:mitochondrial fission ELM1 family protein n=1 Tax=Cognatiluteimonas telluris TaxID=1104775 RepID=UPI001FB032AC|nr:mitochondrial fission ELM1 family protein [Lysobacter telluris]
MEQAASDAMPASPGSGVQAWAVSDDRAGNLRQAQALAQALGGEAGATLQLHPRWPWRAFAPRCLPGSRHAFGIGFHAALASPPALVVGCGRQAALATRLLRSHGARAVQILDPRIDPAHWDVVVAPQHDRLRGSNVLSTLGSLHPVDDAWLAQARVAFAAFAALPRPRTVVLLGGSSRHVRFDRTDFEALADTVDAVRAREGGSLLLTVSRRTPADVLAAVRARPVDAAGMSWLGAQDGPNPYPGLLAWADRIVCSPDSVNMISEACATQAPVHVFEPARAHGRLASFLQALLASGRIRALDGMLAPFDVQPLRETARIAAEVRARLDSDDARRA